MRYSILLSFARVNNLHGKSQLANVFYVTGKRPTGKRPDGQPSWGANVFSVTDKRPEGQFVRCMFCPFRLIFVCWMLFVCRLFIGSFNCLSHFSLWWKKLSRKRYMTANRCMLLWITIVKSWSVFQNPSWQIARITLWRRNHYDVISGLQ